MNDEMRKKALIDQFTPVVDAMGYKFSPDTEMVAELLDAEVMLMPLPGPYP
jgi:hypothetical protein